MGNLQHFVFYGDFEQNKAPFSGTQILKEFCKDFDWKCWNTKNMILNLIVYFVGLLIVDSGNLTKIYIPVVS